MSEEGVGLMRRDFNEIEMNQYKKLIMCIDQFLEQGVKSDCLHNLNWQFVPIIDDEDFVKLLKESSSEAIEMATVFVIEDKSSMEGRMDNRQTLKVMEEFLYDMLKKAEVPMYNNYELVDISIMSTIDSKTHECKHFLCLGLCEPSDVEMVQ